MISHTESCKCIYCERDTLKARVEQLELLKVRWNRAAAEAGICGSEYIDDPERVFEAARTIREIQHKALLKAQQRLAAYEKPEGKCQ